MKPSHRFVLLMLTSALLTLTISLPVTNSAQAATSGQSAEDRIKATLEDAAAALGGGFEWEGPGFWGMVRSNRIAGYSQSQEAVHFIEKISVYNDGTTCTYGSYESYTFHGMSGCLLAWEDELIWGIGWWPQVGVKIDGNVISLQVSSVLDYGCSGTDCGDYGQNIINHFYLAEALHQAAIKNGLYEPMPEEILPIDPLEVVPGQPEVPIDPTIPTDPADTDGLFDIPWPIVLGSLGIPVIGAIAGAVFSTILSGFSSAATSSAPVSNAVASDPPVTSVDSQIGTMDQQDLDLSESPQDQTGPELVPGEELESSLTDEFVEGSDVPGDIEEDWQNLEQDEVELVRPDKSPIPKHMVDLNSDFEAIAQELKKQNKYVVNPYQGDPTVILHRLITAKYIIWDSTVGLWTGSQGLTCEGYVEATQDKVLKAVSNRFPGATVQKMIVEEKSTRNPKGVLNYLDSMVDDNHTLFKIILPDGSEWAVDFHQHAAGNSPVMRPWSETRKAWKDDYMGDEYYERPSVTYPPKSKPSK